MQIDPPLRIAHKFPVSLAVSLAAIILSVINWTVYPLDVLVATTDNALTAPWTTFTSLLLHGSIIHLLFNLSWWWPLGARIEHAWGGKKLLLVTILLALVSGSAQAAFSGPGIGLSGVIYGLFGMLYVVHGSHPVFRGIINKRTVQLMVGWFVACIVLDYLKILPPIGHVAHGVGALAGYLLGRCISAPRPKRTPWIAALSALTILTVAAFTTRAHWPASFNTSSTYARRAAAAFDRKEFQAAIDLYEQARRSRGGENDPAILVDLAIAYLQLNRTDEALPLLLRATELDPANRDALAPTIAAIYFNKAIAAYKSEDLPTAHQLAQQALKWQPAPEIREMIAATRPAPETPPTDAPANPRP